MNGGIPGVNTDGPRNGLIPVGHYGKSLTISILPYNPGMSKKNKKPKTFQELFKSVRKPMAPPSQHHVDKKKKAARDRRWKDEG